MGYQGYSVPINLGGYGLKTDDTSTNLTPGTLAKANNVSVYSGAIEKAKGTTAYNPVALTNKIVSVFDWWPTPNLQRLVAITSEGRIWRDIGDGTFNAHVPIASLGSTLDETTHMVEGGLESQGNNKKLFILTGTNQVQVIDGDSSVTRPIHNPASDWANGNYPTYGVQYQGRMVFLGSSADPSRIYFSFPDDHENFLGKTIVPVFANANWGMSTETNAIPPVPTDQTVALQKGTSIQIFSNTSTATAGPGNAGASIVVQGASQFNTVNFKVSQVSTGATTYTYQYWNPITAAWVTFTAPQITSVPNFSAIGTTQLTFIPPSGTQPPWGIGSDGAGTATDYSIRIIANAALTQAPFINALSVQSSILTLFPPTFSVFPGVGDGIISAIVWRGLLFMFKKPYGVFVLDGRDPDTSNWTITQYSAAFGTSSPHGVLQILTDLVATNSSGSYTSLSAVQDFGDFASADVLATAYVENYFRNLMNPAGIPKCQSIYYPEKKLAYFTGQTSTTDIRNVMMVGDVSRTSQDGLRILIDTKEQPNCLALRKDSQAIQRPMYGAANGQVYLMDQPTYNVNGVPYLGEFQTNYTDMSFVMPDLAAKNKIFDFLEVNFIPTGNGTIMCDVIIDGKLRQTLSYTQKLGAVLGSFILGMDRLSGAGVSTSIRQPMKSCTGRKICFRFYNNTFNQAFKIERIVVSFRVSAEQTYSFQT